MTNGIYSLNKDFESMELTKHLQNIANIVILGFSAISTLVSFLGIIIYASYTTSFGPVWVMNQFIGLWLNILLFYFSILPIYYFIHYKLLDFEEKNSLIFFIFGFTNASYFILSSVLCFLIFLGYAMGKRIDATLWSLYLIIINISTTVLILINNRKSNGAQNEGLLGDQKETSVKTWILHISHIITLVFVGILKIVSIILMALLISGALTFGVGVASYPPKGKIYKVYLPDGRPQNIHVYCTGANNSSRPTMLFEADGSHGFADFYAIQTVLAESGRRSCSWDKPGLGHSDYYYIDQMSDQTYYHQLITSLEDKGPFIFVGWGGGGPVIYEYAYYHPEMFHSMVMLDLYPEKSEWMVPYLLKNMTNGQYYDMMTKDLNSRRLLFNIINGIGVPFGLMSIFLPPASNYPFEFENERRWYFLTEKTWTTQRFMMEISYNTPNIFQTRKVPNIPIHHFLTFHNSSIVQGRCDARKLSPKDCYYEIRANEYINQEKLKLFNQNGGKNVFCREAECNLGFYVYGKPIWTLNELIKLYP